MDRQQRIEFAIEHGVTTQADFESLLDELAHVRLKKSIQYGDRILKEPDAEFARWLAFANIYRKYSRLLQLFRSGTKEALRDCLMDLASYALMGVQLLEKDDDLS